MQQRNLLCIAFFSCLSLKAWSDLPTHCSEQEYAIVDAWMGKTIATHAGYKNTRQGKLLSLCADQPREPFARVSYRYGIPGKVEMNLDATSKAPFTIANFSTGRTTGMDVVGLYQGEFSYYVAINGGQASGIALTVFKGQKKIVEHFSGNHEGEDFQLGEAEIDLSGNQARSPVLKMGKLKHALF